MNLTAYTVMDTIQFGIITVSDTCSVDPSLDRAGPHLQDEIKKVFPNAKILRAIVPDEKILIKEKLKEFCDSECNAIFTVGGTGFSPRDVTPEATKEVISREANGLEYVLVSESLKVTEMGMLSRPVCGIRDRTVILNFPGSAKAAVECFGFVKGVLSHAVSVLSDKKLEIAEQHNIIQNNSQSVSVNVDFTESKVNLSDVAQRKRVSPHVMISVNEALEMVFRECSQTNEIECISYKDAINRVLAEDFIASEPIPPFRAAIKDGYAALRADDSTMRKVVNYVTAGDKDTEQALNHGEVIRISTGAIVPPGADIVIPVENTYLKETSKGEERYIGISKMDEDKNIREIGSDVQAGSLIMEKYEKITYSHIGALASLGQTTLRVFKQPIIGILSTGNEIVDPSNRIQPGQIRDANKVTLTNLLKRYGYSSEDFGIVKDQPNAIKLILEKCFAKSDLLITTGGMSMGEYDILKDVLVQDFDAKIHFARINMKPGKPTAFATLYFNGKRKLYFGLPGNPVSCSVTCLLLVIPLLRHLERSKTINWPVIKVPCDLKNNDERPEYHRVQVKIGFAGALTLESTGNQISSRLNSMVGANGLALVKRDTMDKDHKSIVDVLLFDDLIME